MPLTSINNATIDSITRDRGNTLVTVTQNRRPGNRGNENTFRLVVDDRTIALNRDGRTVPASTLRVGMVIDAQVSPAMTRSIPPQTTAFLIRIVREPNPEPPRPEQPRPEAPRPRPPRPEPPERWNTTVGRIWNIDRRNRSFETITDRDFSTIVRFNVPEDARIFNRMGRPMNFSGLNLGMRVQVRHANFMTASIPPQTTAFEIRVI